MEQVVPWSRLLKALSPYYYPESRGKRGRPPIPLKRILRMYFVQQWYALADEALGDAIYEHQLTLVYSHEMGDGEGKIPILASAGSALLCLSAGESIEWPVRGRKNLHLKIISVQR